MPGEITLHVEMSRRRKHTFSGQHMFAARYFADTAQTIERAGRQEEFSRHRTYVTGAILSAVAYLEGSINEFFHEAAERDREKLPSLDEEVLARLGQLGDDVAYKGILHKYQRVLEAARVPLFDEDLEVYRDAESLIKLRNALIHYKPEWDDERGRHHTLRERLEGRFKVNRLVGAGTLWFPHLCLGAGCAQWATNVATAFSNEFCARLKIPSRD